jgi:hypothetical protein
MPTSATTVWAEMQVSVAASIFSLPLNVMLSPTTMGAWRVASVLHKPLTQVCMRS